MDDLQPSATRGGYKMRRDQHDGKLHRVVVLGGVEGYVVSWTQSCSGCDEVPEMTARSEAGIGCHECGYTGKRRQEFWCPFDLSQWDQAHAHLSHAEA
jgi:hypothetical protein